MRTILDRMHSLIYIILLFLISCATDGEYRDLLPKEERTAQLAFEFENSQNNSAKIQIFLCKHLTENNKDMEDTCEFKVSKSLDKKEKLLYKLPPGDYYAKFEVSDKKIIPLIVFENTGIKAMFGYKNESKNYFFYSKTFTKDYNPTNCNKEKWEPRYCPKLVLEENTRSTFKIYILSDYEFDGEGTTVIWGGSVLLSAQTRLPILLPLFMGFVSIKRDIKHNLK